jgi:MscS family membrane protein
MKAITCVWAASLLIGVAAPATAQTGGRNSQPPPAEAPKEATDPFGRHTPRGTITGFELAVHKGDFVTAARHLQLTQAQRPNTERLARDLTDLIDRFYAEPITALSDRPEGVADDGLPLNRERVVLTIAGKPIDIELVRVKDAEAGQVWLIASQSLAQVPALHRSAADDTWFERVMPPALVAWTVFGVSVAQWIGWAATIVVPLLLLWLLTAVFTAVARRNIADPVRRRLFESWHDGLRWLVVLVITLGIHGAFLPVLGFSLRFRYTYGRVLLAVVVVLVAWTLSRFLALSLEHTRVMAQRRGQAGIRSLLLLAERVCKALIVLVAIFLLLTIGGVDTTTALAGVGLGGVALALGAQKSVENLLGGVFLLTDNALAVGDTCSISNRVGVVEDVTLRSVRLRTVEQTLLSVPAGILSQSNVENFATRNKILVQSMLRLQYGTTSDQLRLILSRIRLLLEEHADIETDSSRIRLVDFGVQAIELELFAYVLTADYVKFLSVREELLLQIAKIVESSGVAFAQPTHTIHRAQADDAKVVVRAAVER